MGEYADSLIEQMFDYLPYKPNLRDYPRMRKEPKALLIRGKAKWAKVLGAPVWGYENTFKEWTVDVYIDEATSEKLKNEGLKDVIKNKGDGDYIVFRRKELKQDGSPNKPIRVVDAKGNTWNQDVRIGNGSTVNVNFAPNEYKKGKFSVNILALQVWDHVPYNGGDFPVKEDGDEGGDDDWANEVAE